jgi:hypothetical protein
MGRKKPAQTDLPLEGGTNVPRKIEVNGDGFMALAAREARGEIRIPISEMPTPGRYIVTYWETGKSPAPPAERKEEDDEDDRPY